MTRTAAAASVGVSGCLGSPKGSDDETGDGVGTEAEVETVAEGLTDPWGVAFLTNPDRNHADDRLVVTEKSGRLLLVDRTDGTTEVVEGTPDVYDAGQGGMLDVTLHPDYPVDDRLYLTYSATDGGGRSATHVGAGRLDAEAVRLEGFEVLSVAEPFVDSVNHYGSRAVFGDDGKLYVTSGDRQFKNFGPGHVSQDVTNELGCVLRLNPDGSAPDDNPFADEPVARDTVYSYGHRNPQGLTVHPETGDLWESEHGERDGDEINVIEGGANYGWPVATEACEYGTDTPVGVSHGERDGVTPPAYVWECGTGGFPPAGMTFCTGESFPDRRGDLFVGNLAAQYLGRFEVDGREVTEAEPLLGGRGWRVRDVAEAPDDGYLYAIVDGGDAPLIRLVPDGGNDG
jgi:quinoprotein glucose dehydrogenase